MDNNDIDKVIKGYLDSERKVKLNSLFTFFCNHVFLGQWELAKTAIPTLVKETGKYELSTDFVEILIKVAEYPFSQSLGSQTIPTPHHLSWLCLQELKQLFPEPDSEKRCIIDRLGRDVDFRLTLSELKDADSKVIQELYVYFKKIVLKVQCPNVDDVDARDFLSAASLAELKKTMLTSPTLGDSVVRALMPDGLKADRRDGEMLQAIYLECVNCILDNIEAGIKHGLGSEELELLTDHALQILALYNPAPYWNYLQLRQLFTRLLNISGEEKFASLTAERIVSVLCGRQNDYLLDEFSKIYQEASVLRIVSLCDVGSEELSDKHRVFLHLMTQMDRDECWRDFFINCQKQQTHFLGEIVNLSLSLVKARRFGELQDLLSFPEFQPLKPAVMLIGWSQCETSVHARTLVDMLWDDSEENYNSALVATCRKLVYHLDFVQWCMDRARPSLLEGCEDSGTRAMTLLRDLESHSVLHVLHQFTGLRSFNPTEVLQHLINAPDGRKKETKHKAVTFQDQSRSGSVEPINVEQQRDIAIFRSYCALNNVMDAIVFCADNFEHGLMNPVEVKSSIKSRTLRKNFTLEKSLSSSEGDDSSSQGFNGDLNSVDKQKLEREDLEKFFESYETIVTRGLTEAKEHLSHLQPLTYRLEILENIFSLLFVTHEDLVDASDSMDPDSAEENEDSKRSSLDNLKSQDSFNISIVSEEEGVDDEMIHRSKSSESFLFSMADNLSPETFDGAVEYDKPFIDQFEKSKSPTVRADIMQSSYFSADKEFHKEAEKTSKPNHQLQLPSIPKKLKRRKKCYISEFSQKSVVGFLLNDYLVRDLLHMLKGAISDLNTAKSTLYRKVSDSTNKISQAQPNPHPATVSLAVENALRGCVRTSVQIESLPKRISKLSQTVHEAWWRFQMIAHEVLPRQAGHILTDRVYVTDNNIDFLPTCQGTAYSPEASDSRDFSETRDPHCYSRKVSNTGLVNFGSQLNIVAKMLASPESLLVLSLAKNNMIQAAEVIKLFRLKEKTVETCEVTFAEIYRARCAQIWDLELEINEASHHPHKIGKRNVIALSKAAAQGVATASLSHIIEDLLAKPCLPPLPRPKTAFAKDNFSYLFHLDTPSALLLDILCTSCRTWETCSNMLDIMKARTPKILQLDSHRRETTRRQDGLSPSPDAHPDLWSTSQSEFHTPDSQSSASSGATLERPKNVKYTLSGVVGCLEFVHTLQDLMQQIDNDSHIIGAQHISYLSGNRVGLQHCLNSAYPPLHAENRHSMEMAGVELRQAVDRVLQLLMGCAQDRHVNISMKEVAPSPSPSPRGSFSGSLSGSMTGSFTSATKPPKKQQEQHPLHIAVKQLMRVMERCVPGEGFTQLVFSKSSRTSTPPVKNYLLSLYEHVKEITHLVSQCENKGSVSEVITNYFKVLEDGPVSVLGRLMFVKQMPPAKLETVAEKLSLNLTHIIVYSCCPKIPSKHRAMLPDTVANNSDKLWGTCVFNVHSSQDAAESHSPELGPQKSSHPEVAVRAILTDLVRLMEYVLSSQNAKGVFDLMSAKRLVKLSEYQRIKDATRELKHVDMNLLQPGHERLCFYTNLTNLMVMHCHLTNIHTRHEILLGLDEREAAKHEEEIALCPSGVADNLTYFSSFSYSVGQLGIISVFDLLHILCCNGLAPTSQWNNIMSCRQLVLSPKDPWSQFCPSSEPRLTFVLNMGCASSPPLRVMRPDTFVSQLDQAMKEYLSHSVTISVEQEKVCVPQLLMWNEKNFVEVQESPIDNKHSDLLNWISQYVNAEKQRQLQQLFHLDSVHGFSENIDLTGRKELPFSVETDYFDNTYLVTFDTYDVKTGSGSVRTSSREKQMNTQAHLSHSFERSGSRFGLEHPSYNLTPITLEYVKHDSLLVATMVSLVCADNLDNIEQQFTDNHFNVPNTSPLGTGAYYDNIPSSARCSSSDISLVDIRSYRYQRLTNDYPILQRHLLHYILPLAGADNPELLESREPILKFVTNVIDDQVKLCMFSLPSSQQFQGVIQDMANRLLEERKWLELLAIIRSLSENIIYDFLHLQVLHDFVLSCWAVHHVSRVGYAPKVGDGMRKFYNPFLQARTVLTIIDHMSLDLSLDLLDLCLTKLDKGLGLWQAVNAKRSEMHIYKKIMMCVKTLHVKLSMRDIPIPSMRSDDMRLLQIIEGITGWQSIPKITEDCSEDLLLVLEKAGDFFTAKAWGELYGMSHERLLDIKKRHLQHLLTRDHPDTVTAFQLLDNLRKSSEADCLSICRDLASSLSKPTEIKFVLSFMLQCLTPQVEPEQLEDLRLTRIGAKALMCIPDNIQEEYSHLISCPHLILEQLLMNMKAELAGQVFEQIKLDFMDVRESKMRVAQDQFNSLLATYANKALEVTAVQVLVNKSRSASAGSSESSRQDEEVANIMRKKHDRGRSDLSVSPSHSAKSGQSSRPDTASKTGGKNQSLSLSKGSGRFVMPAQPPTQDQWMPDNATSVCMVCHVEQFSMFNRRHHCRRCGRVVCAACSTKQTLVFGIMARTCDECFEQMNNSSDQRAQEEHEIYSRRIKERLSGVGSDVSPSAFATSPVTVGLPSLLGAEGLRQSLTAAIHHIHHSWKLQPEATDNQRVRDEFYYEQAPSVSLCMSLLKQHSSRLEAGKCILTLCDTLSGYLVPISGVPNPEIDYSLIISIMKQLLFQAKVDFLQSGDSSMTGQSDMYQGRVDLLGVLVEANYQDLPTIKELTKQDSVRRLRDKLIADERLSLAMEVSTKCGIDPAGVWSAMGFACLHLSDFQGARDKFGHCLKVPADKNQAAASQTRLLGEILEFLDSIPNSGLTEFQRMLKDPASICDLKTLLSPSVAEENRVESVPYKECLYYLKTYGSYMDDIAFLRRHGYWMKAVQFTVEQHCSTSVFVNELLVPALNSGEMGHLLDLMLNLDPSLEKWTAYLTATCKHLLKQKHFYTLYQVQIFMKDYIRAAMTCITHFYQRGATSYLDLSGRLQFLFTAQQHLQAYLDPGQWGSVCHPLAVNTPSPTGHGHPRHGLSWEKKPPESEARMALSPNEVKKHIKTIALQIEVTKFLEQCLTQALGGVASLASNFVVGAKSLQLPTLFGQTSDRTELISMVLLSGNNFMAGFDLVLRIVKECRLNATLNFTHCSRELAKQGRFPEINTLIQALIREELVGDEAIDEIVGASILVIADSQNQPRDECDSLIQLLRNDSNKINAFILCGKLRSAYLLAVKREKVEDVQRIAGAAQRLGQSAVKNICKKWLEKYQK